MSNPVLNAVGSGVSENWTPQNLNDTNMLLWLDASELSTVPVQWDDKSQYNNHANLNGDNSNGDVTIDVRNNKSVIKFSGANGFFYQWSQRLTNIKTAIVVSRRLGGSAPILGDSSVPNFHSLGGRYFHSAVIPFHNTGNFHLNGVVYSEDANTSSIWTAEFGGTNSSSLASTSGGYDISIVRSPVDLIVHNFANDRNIPGRIWEGEVCEIILFSNELSLVDTYKLEGYLSHKWSLNLPSTGFMNEFNVPSDPHPYRVNVPIIDGFTIPNWVRTSGEWSSEIATGILRGISDGVSIKQDITITQNGIYDVLITRTDTEEGLIVKLKTSENVKWLNHLNDLTNEVDIPFNTIARFEVHDLTPIWIEVDTVSEALKVLSISMKKVILATGTIEELSNNTIRKSAGMDGWNAGTSSTQYIGGQGEGYVQFQMAQSGKDIKVGLVYEDIDYSNADPFEMLFSGTSVHIQNDVRSSYVSGDWFRIRHNSVNNQIVYLKRDANLNYQPFYTDMETTDGRNLYLDTSFYHMGSRINDVSMVN